MARHDELPADQFPQALYVFPLKQTSPGPPHEFALGSLDTHELRPVEPAHPLQLQAIELPLVVQLFGSEVISQIAQS